MSDLLLYNQDFMEKVDKVRKTLDDLAEKAYKETLNRSFNPTPKERVKKRPDGYDYVPEKYMRLELDKEFPGWSWIEGDSWIYNEKVPIWVCSKGTLKILNKYLLSIGAPDPFTYYFSTGASRIQYAKVKKVREKLGEMEGKTMYKEVEVPLGDLERYQPQYMIDLDKQMAAANSNAFKRGVNRLCHLFDDVYGKRPDDELMPSQIEILNDFSATSEKVAELIEKNMDKITPDNFDQFVAKLKVMVEREKMNGNVQSK